MKQTVLTGLLLAAAVGLIVVTCSLGPKLPVDVSSAIEAAGDNGAELEKVITHYRTAGDTLKLEAALFLIGNMEGHGYATYDLKDTADNVVAFDVNEYPSYDSLKTSFSVLEAEHGELDFGKKELLFDVESITADFLITQIDYAFRAWQERPWAQHLSFDEFSQYVLPYRGSGEPLEPWRKYFFEKYADLADSMTDPTDPVEAASLINDDIKTYFTFDPRYYYHPTDLGLSEMLQTGVGRCEDMTNITIYAMRANGLAVTSDYTPAWADAGNNHAWNAILHKNGAAIPFMGAESNPREYKLSSRPAKVYRKTFSHQRDNLVFQEHKQEKLPGWLRGKSYVDVTGSYGSTIGSIVSVQTIFNKPVPDSIDIAYLCVFNSGEWKPIDWARISGDRATFIPVGGLHLYLPALYMNEEVVPYGPPLANISEFGYHHFVPKADTTITLRLTSTTRRKQVASTDGIEKPFLTPSVEYELFYFDDGWQSLGIATATDKPLVFDAVPVGCLYWLVAEDSDHEERPFSYDDDRQVWW
jgi:hypothetical protein